MKFPRWELRHTADPLDMRAYGGDGGDGGTGQMRQDELDRQRKVQDAVDVINRRFGQASTSGPRTPAPDKNGFYRNAATGAAAPIITPGNVGQYGMPGAIPGYGAGDTDPAGGAAAVERVFDQAGYDKAMAEWQATGASADAEAAANKTAREAMYADIAGAVKDTAMRDLDRQYTTASRRNKFGLARAGQLGGSVDAEAGGELATLYGEGKLKATQAGQGAASDLRVADERTRQNLISLAQSGLDTGTAASMAAGQMGAAAELAKSQAAGATVGRMFDDLSQAYVNNQIARARYGTQPQQSTTSYGYGGFSPSRYTGNVQR